MNTIRFPLMVAILLVAVCNCFSQPIAWSGAGDGTSWTDAQNWVGQQVPGAANVVFITNQGAGAVVISSVVTVESILCSNALAISGGSLAVTAGASLLQGTLTISNGGVLSAGGIGTTLSSGGLVNITEAGLSVSGGAVLSLPGVTTFQAGCDSVYWQASGAGSVLELPGLISLQEPTCYDSLIIEGLNGGQVILGSAVTIEAANGNVVVRADGSNSLVNFSALSSNLAVLSLEASGGGSVLVSNLATSGNMTLTVDSGGFISAAQFTNIDDSSLYVTGGEVLALPGVRESQASCGSITWEASGPGSVLELPGLTNLTEPTCYDSLTIQGSSGGQVILSSVVSIAAANGEVSVQADGSNSLVNLSALATNLAVLSLEASGGGSVVMPSFATSGNLTLTVNSGGFISAAQFTNIDGGSLYVTGGEVLALPGLRGSQASCGNVTWEASGEGTVLQLPGLTNLTEPVCYDSLTIQGLSGGQVILSSVVSIAAANGEVAVKADGSNSLVNLSALATNLAALSLEASGGGGVLMPSFATSGNMSLTLNPGGFISTAQFTNVDGASLAVNGGEVLSLPGVVNFQSGCGNVIWEAAGAGSVLDFPALVTLQEPACFDTLTIEGVNGGQVNLPHAVIIGANNGYVTLQADGSNSLVNLPALATNLATLAIEASGGGDVTVSSLATSGVMTLSLNPGGFISLAQFTNVDGANFSANAGVILSLPGVASYHSGCGNIQWVAAGAGSVLELPELTTIQEPTCDDTLTIQGKSGGQVLLSNVVTILAGDGFVSAEADGSNSLVNLSALSTNSGALSLEASGGGNVQVPSLAISSNMTLTLNSGGLIPTAQFTNVDGASLYANGGAVLTLPGVTGYVPGCVSPEWEASGAGSILDLPGLTTLQGADCNYTFKIDAVGGGQVILGDLQSIANGDAAFLSEDTGSIIDLTNLTYFVTESGQGSLTEQNGGVILFTSQALLLGNLAINIPAGNPILPPTLSPSQPLTLYGTAGHSYRLEERNTLEPGGPVVTLLIPLTNSFQVIAAVPPPNTDITVTDFVANPPILQIDLTPDNEAQLVLFGLTNATYQLQSTTNLVAPIAWTTASVAVMTNAFRIFPEVSAAARQFYRAEQQ
jgi:hypothetical protein